MLEPDFQLPDKATSELETKKRLDLLDWFNDYIKGSVTALIVSGSLSYGQNYSVKPTSDIDMQLLVTPKTVDQLLKTSCFNDGELAHAVAGYKKGFFKQFSLVFKKNDVPLECHFWDEQAFFAAITFQSETTKRLRSSIETPSTDYGYSFDRKESIQDYYGEMVDRYAVSDFPSFRNIDGQLFLCRPITNILGIPLVKISNDALDDAVEMCWLNATRELIQFAEGKPVDLTKISIANTLPGKNKMSQEALNAIQKKTSDILSKLLPPR